MRDPLSSLVGDCLNGTTGHASASYWTSSSGNMELLGTLGTLLWTDRESEQVRSADCLPVAVTQCLLAASIACIACEVALGAKGARTSYTGRTCSRNRNKEPALCQYLGDFT